MLFYYYNIWGMVFWLEVYIVIFKWGYYKLYNKGLEI